jgi:hypothetical protein
VSRHGKPRTTGTAGRLSESYGERGNTVRLWEREPGSAVMLQWGKPPSYESLGYAVRERDGRGRWAWDADRLERAREEAKDKAAKLRLGQVRSSVQATALTVREAFDLFTDDHAGGMPGSSAARRNHRNTARVFSGALGGRPWNTVPPAEWEAVIWRAKGAGKHGKAEMLAKNLRTVHRWLVKKRRMRDLLDPLDEFDWKALRRGVKPRRERYTEQEMARLLDVRDGVDPRFALALVIAAEAGPRSKAIRLWVRSQLDMPMQPAPTADEAPNGWTYLPPLKGQDEPLIFLTAFARREIEKALTGYLRHLEARYQGEGIDYPMLPGARIADAKPQVVRLDQSGALRPVGESPLKDWLVKAERLAGVKHVEHRGWHGLRRLWTDRVEDVAGLDVAAVAGQWADRSMVERIYRRKAQHGKLAKAREALDKRTERLTQGLTDPEKGA